MIQELHHAIRQGNLEAVTTLLDAGTDINTPDRQGWTPLSRAIERKRPEIARLLLEREADVNAQDHKRRQPLHWAAQYGPDDIAEALIVQGVKVDASDTHGNRPLVQAIRHGRTAIVERLLKWGEWSNTTKNYYWNEGFFLAIRSHRLGIVKTFLDVGQSADSTFRRRYSTFRRWYSQGYYDMSALMEAVKAGDRRIIGLLIEYGADVLKKFKRRSAVAEALGEYGENSSITQMLLAAGAHLGLEEALVAGNLVLAKRFLNDSLDVEMADADGETLLIWAASHCQTNFVRILVRHGADINTRGRNGDTALTGAAVRDTGPLRFLVAHGADPNVGALSWHQPPLTYAARAGRFRATKWLLERFGLGADGGASALIGAASRGHLEIARLLLDVGVSADAHTDYFFGHWALMSAALHGPVDITRLLLDRGADVNACDPKGRSALFFAAGAGRKQVTRLLIEREVDAEQKAKALLEALLGGRSDTAEILLQGGAEPVLVTYDHQTALMLAARNGRLSVVQMLLDKGVDVNAVDRKGKTALMWAKESGNANIAALLRQYVQEDN